MFRPMCNRDLTKINLGFLSATAAGIEEMLPMEYIWIVYSTVLHSAQDQDGNKDTTDRQKSP